ncbi:TIGR03088 family PEP-CTERM/XrtA system glycosyltransferase [Pelomonas sp. CA6]|uniref:TIGR03088 family PEP-CTERM/XrtA system glycosyltransferase n=1 Tax=Pelomonas sp. CA6 TaxID=2907999 RepID=UPI001F4C131D|nr:TIGR03088 family PEP-CTERM/XrtA system glycosyltransferase [Pelomonas sp. CA6]MCH7344159.1 TIGR03088 family PEP-CTERM/XrtA system glycosyltransferase [Pelomonas sp. CA6]
MSPERDETGRPLIAHVVYRFDTGGLENGLVNLINEMGEQHWRHAVIALTEVSERFRQRVRRADVRFIALNKPPGHAFALYPRVWRLLRELRPAVLHTRNLAALELQPVGWAAGVPVRIHGEHGRDMDDLHGLSRKHQRIRRAFSPFVHRHVALSRDLAGYLRDRVGLDAARIVQIYNGVDTERFHPAPPGGADDTTPSGWPFGAPGLFVFGSVGRMQDVKNPLLLTRAFARLLREQPALRERLRLVQVGEGPLRGQVQALLAQEGLSALAWLPGDRADVPALMRRLDAFVLPSRAEGISNTILEAMGCALPVLATEVGGNAELLQSGQQGLLLPEGDEAALTRAMAELAADPARARAMGQAGRARVQAMFSLQSMRQAYEALYRRELAGRTGPVAHDRTRTTGP